jgi:hypothetical protein
MKERIPFKLFNLTGSTGQNGSEIALPMFPIGIRAMTPPYQKDDSVTIVSPGRFRPDLKFFA